MTSFGDISSNREATVPQASVGYHIRRGNEEIARAIPPDVASITTVSPPSGIEPERAVELESIEALAPTTG